MLQTDVRPAVVGELAEECRAGVELAELRERLRIVGVDAGPVPPAIENAVDGPAGERRGVVRARLRAARVHASSTGSSRR
jgi:hypothetical protein